LFDAYREPPWVEAVSYRCTEPKEGTEMRSEPGTKLTVLLLAAGIVAGPFYVVLGVIQVLIREGFDPTRHPLSLLSNGRLGWIQILNFLVSGFLVVACAVGMRRAVQRGPGATWGPLLVGAYGVGLIAAGIFVADPMDGFPPGTPSGPPKTISGHGVLHFIAGALGFFSLIAACLVFARRFARLKLPSWAAYSAATGVLFFAAFGGIASGSQQARIVIAFTVAVVLVWAWIAAVSARLIAELNDASG
jgi:Protein of unknown function (DUF998)